jgi:hypothetical protein
MTEPVVRTPQRANGQLPTEPHAIDAPVANPDINAERHSESPPGTPRWVKLFGIALVVLVLLLAGLHLTGQTPTHGMPIHGMSMQDGQMP